jgi:iron complex transport system substrate-binding protein
MPTVSRLSLLALGLICLNALADAPPRVITLAPHLTELVYAIGAEDRLVGVVDYSDFPPEARSMPRIGDAFRFDLERILVLNADLALAWEGGTPAAVIDDLRRLGIAVESIETRRLGDLPRALRVLGERLQHAETGEAAARNFEGELARLRRQFTGQADPLRVFYQVSRRPLYTLGGRHLINDAMAVCGMTNVFAGLDAEAAVVSREAVVGARPDLILGADASEALIEDWQSGALAALIQAEVRTIDPDLLTRPSPRILDGIAELCSLRTSLPSAR